MSFQTYPLISAAVRFTMILVLIVALAALLALVAGRALPGGGAIGFLSNRDGNNDIYVFDIARDFVHNLTDNGAVNGYFAFSPDGTRMAFESNKDGNTEIYMMYVECPGLFTSCGGVQQFTDADTDSRNPVWSPDGTKIAYEYDVSWENADNEIYMIDVDSRETRNVTNHPANDRQPAWSPDGSRMAFISDRDSNPMNEYLNMEIYTVTMDGKTLQRMTYDESYDTNPRWSLDGSWIAFESLGLPENISAVSRITANGNQFEQVKYGSVLGVVANQSDWLPNTNQIVILLINGESTEIAIIDLETDRIIQLTHDYFTNRGISLSSDGRYVAFDSSDYGSVHDIYIAETTGSFPPRLIYSGAALPAWWPERTP
jgi:Tol biopolymer transport system component